MNIILIGFKNSGKTSVAKILAEKNNQAFIDTDDLIELHYQEKESAKLSVRDIYRQKGEIYFRDMEKTIIATLNEANHNIVATGGGCILDDSNIIHLKKHGKIIYLFSPLDILIKRLKSQETPAFLDTPQPEEKFAELYEQREKIYRQTADITIFTEEKSIAIIAEEIILLTRHLNG